MGGQKRRRQGASNWYDIARVSAFVTYTKTLYSHGHLSLHQFVFHAVWPVERVHIGRIEEGSYRDLHQLDFAMEQLRQAHGLEDGSHWLQGHGPGEYERLNAQYDHEHAHQFRETLREFGLRELAELHETDLSQFERLRERGRRAALETADLQSLLKDLVVRYEDEAQRAAAAHVYSGALILLASALESLLLLRCLRSKATAQRIAAKLPKKYHPRTMHDLSSWRFETILQTALTAGWFRNVQGYSTSSVVEHIEQLRQYLQPAQHVLERPWLEIDRKHHERAHSFYRSLRQALG